MYYLKQQIETFPTSDSILYISFRQIKSYDILKTAILYLIKIFNMTYNSDSIVSTFESISIFYFPMFLSFRNRNIRICQ